jgi:hypothetical protein
MSVSSWSLAKNVLAITTIISLFLAAIGWFRPDIFWDTEVTTWVRWVSTAIVVIIAAGTLHLAPYLGQRERHTQEIDSLQKQLYELRDYEQLRQIQTNSPADFIIGEPRELLITERDGEISANLRLRVQSTLLKSQYIENITGVLKFDSVSNERIEFDVRFALPSELELKGILEIPAGGVREPLLKCKSSKRTNNKLWANKPRATSIICDALLIKLEGMDQFPLKTQGNNVPVKYNTL